MRNAQRADQLLSSPTHTTVWVDYERIQGDIFDYLIAVMPEFGLSLYQQPSGADMRVALGGGGE
ncbi:hypothetical protein AO390_06670 [Pseudomonas marginalis ICMP 11289]|nr:hypothetical protein AO390_06670 [Pseudomonas marginalis ICMP 11289]